MGCYVSTVSKDEPVGPALCEDTRPAFTRSRAATLTMDGNDVDIGPPPCYHDLPQHPNILPDKDEYIRAFKARMEARRLAIPTLNDEVPPSPGYWPVPKQATSKAHAQDGPGAEPLNLPQTAIPAPS